MLTLDLSSLSEKELEQAISRHCARLGKVESVTIRRPAGQSGNAVALVSMSTAAELDELLLNFGDAKSGSTVEVRLEQAEKSVPISLKRVPDERPENAQSGLSGKDSALMGSGQRPAIDILLVEDDPADVRMTREALRVAGIACRLHVVEDGLEAISFLCNTRQFSDAPRPHIIVLDLNIPRINGHEVLGEIRSNNSLRDIPVVVLTCSKSEIDMQKSRHMKADRFMTKAMGLDAFVEQIKSIVALAAH